jgi:signal transduction histidine kinase/PAS domain-containing protein
VNEDTLTVTAPQKVTPQEPAAPRSEALGLRLTPATRAAIKIVPAFKSHPLLVSYGAAVAMPAGALLLTMALEAYLQNIILVFFWPAVIGAAILGGLGPAVVASVVSVALSDIFLIASHDMTPRAPEEIVRFGAFFVTSLLVGTLAHTLQTERRRAGDAAIQNARLAAKLDQKTVELEHQLEESQSLQEELEHSSTELGERTAQAEAADKFSSGILASIADPFIVHDSQWHVRYINAAAARIYERTRGGDAQALLGKTVWEILPNILGTKFETEMRRSARERIPVTFEAFYAERGEWALMFCYPLPDGGLAVQWKDISAIKRAEEASRYLSRATEALSVSLDYETTLSELASLVAPEFADWAAVEVIGDDGRAKQVAVAHVNPDKVRWAYEINKRYPPNPSATTGVYNVLRTGRPEFYPEISDEMLAQGAADEEHLKLISEIGFKSAIIVPLIARGRTLGALTLVTAESGRRYTQADLDLATELARRAALAVDNARLHKAELEARRAAEAASAAKTQFLAVMSHELRTPLNAIAGYAELMRMGIRGPVTPEQRADLDRIRVSQRDLLSLINDVLNYAKLDAGHIEFDTQNVPLRPFLADIEALVTPQLQAKGIKYVYEVCDKAVTVRADMEKLRQVVLNLLSNAIKFTPAGGEVQVDCVCDDKQVLVRLRDTGVGIPEDKLDAIFDPFVQLDRKLTSTHEGTGLGLAISRDLARGMDGDLTVESRVGEGSTFTLALPRGESKAD